MTPADTAARTAPYISNAELLQNAGEFDFDLQALLIQSQISAGAAMQAALRLHVPGLLRGDPDTYKRAQEGILSTAARNVEYAMAIVYVAMTEHLKNALQECCLS